MSSYFWWEFSCLLYQYRRHNNKIHDDTSVRAFRHATTMGIGYLIVRCPSPRYMSSTVFVYPLPVSRHAMPRRPAEWELTALSVRFSTSLYETVLAARPTVRQCEPTNSSLCFLTRVYPSTHTCMSPVLLLTRHLCPSLFVNSFE